MPNFLFSGARKSSEPIKSVDSSIVNKLAESGYNVNASGMSAEQLKTSAQPTYTQLVPGGYVPTYQTSDGRTNVVDESGQVYVVTKNPAVPDFGGNTTIRTPEVTPVIPTNTGGTGGVVPQTGGTITPPVTIPPGSTNLPPVITPSTPLPSGPGGLLGSGKIYTKFEMGDVVPNQQATITRAMWSNNVGNLLTFYTSSSETATQKRYYYEIYNSSSAALCNSEAQFSIAFGHKAGSGSADEGGQVNDTPSRAIYGQYRLMCLEPGQEKFIIGGTATDYIYAINVNRARMREQIDEGNIEINIHSLSGSFFGATHPVNAHTGSNVKLGIAGKVVRLIDDSTTTAATVTSVGEVYNIVSGSIEQGVYNPSSPHKYGLLYPRLGVVILSGPKLDQSASFLTVTGSEIPGDNAYKLFTAMSGAAQYTDASGDRLGFAARSVEKVKSTHYFVRVKNAEYNFTNNPTFVTGSEGDLSQPTMIGDPQVYITTVGLYNGRKELMAVAKLSKPLLKNFTRESLIKVKLDY